jgi:hypothetical protein
LFAALPERIQNLTRAACLLFDENRALWKVLVFSGFKSHPATVRSSR